MATRKKKATEEEPKKEVAAVKAQVIGPDSYEPKVSVEGEVKYVHDFSSWKEYNEYKGAKK